MTLLLGLLPLLAAAGLGALARHLARLLPPAAAVRILTAASVVTALSSGYVLSLAAFTLLARFPALASDGRWTRAVLGRGVPVPPWAGVALALVVLVLVSRSVRCAARQMRTFGRAHTLCRRLDPGADQVVLVEDVKPLAYAVFGLPGRIVVSSGMASALPPDELSVLLAHERSHLRNGHQLYVAVARLAAAANPLLVRVPEAVGFGIERWADEDACRSHDRSTAVRALARAGLATLEPAVATVPAVAHAARGHVVERVTALTEERPGPRRMLSAALVVGVVATLAATMAMSMATEHRFETAGKDYRAHHLPA